MRLASLAIAVAAYTTQLTVVPLYRAPPQPRGWLTEEERDFLDHHRRKCAERASTFSNTRAVPWVRRVKLIDALLARSTPPEVVKPGPWKAVQPFPGHESWQPFIDQVTAKRDKEWIAALAAAGVAVKEGT